MNKIVALLTVISALLFACSPAEKNPTGDDTIRVLKISLDKSTLTLKEGESAILTATIVPENAENQSCNWSSGDDQIAAVDGEGKVTGVKAGKTTITVKSEDGGKTANCAVTVEKNLDPSVTIGADKVTAISVVLQGKANLGNSVASDLKVGFQYSTSAGILPSNSTTLEAQDADADYNYTAVLSGLVPETTYYFRSFVRQNGQDVYGETKSFTTKDVASLLETKDATGITADSAVLNGKLDLTDIKYNEFSFGFLWGTSKSDQDQKSVGSNIYNNAFSISLSGLSANTDYWYKAYVMFDGNEPFYGEVNSFMTAAIPVESVSLDRTEYTFAVIGNTVRLQATIQPSNATDKQVEWFSDNEAVAAVNSDGVVTATGVGNATITVKTVDQEKTATCCVIVPSVNPSTGGYGDDVSKALWLELPATVAGDGREVLVHDMQGGKYLDQERSGDRNWSCYWDYAEHVSLWVAYPLNSGLIGSGTTTGTNPWGLDPLLPASIQPNLTSGSYGGGWMRGHQISSGDRCSNAARVSPFYGTTITPQEYDFNGIIWVNLQNAVRGFAFKSDTLYVVSGCVLEDSDVWTGSNSGFRIRVPAAFYKALLYRGTSTYATQGFMAAGFYLPHDAQVAEEDYRDYLVSIDELEEKTGIDFFPNLETVLDKATAAKIESTVTAFWK